MTWWLPPIAPHRRRLARAVRLEKAVDDARFDVEVEAVDGGRRFVSFGESVRENGARGVAHSRIVV